MGPARHDSRFEKSAWVLSITTRVLLRVHGFELTAPTHALRQPGFFQLDPALVSMRREFYEERRRWRGEEEDGAEEARDPDASSARQQRDRHFLFCASVLVTATPL